MYIKHDREGCFISKIGRISKAYEFNFDAGQKLLVEETKKECTWKLSSCSLAWSSFQPWLCIFGTNITVSSPTLDMRHDPWKLPCSQKMKVSCRPNFDGSNSPWNNSEQCFSEHNNSNSTWNNSPWKNSNSPWNNSEQCFSEHRLNNFITIKRSGE